MKRFLRRLGLAVRWWLKPRQWIVNDGPGKHYLVMRQSRLDAFRQGWQPAKNKE